jgi:UDP-N-acetylmuramoylalanine-D-glutamate ligase
VIHELALRRLELEGGALPDDLDPFPATLVKSPGIRGDAPIVEASRAAGLTVIDEAELGWRLDSRTQLAVTGTNGKSTTAMLAAELLRADGLEAIVAGNTTFGPPLSSASAEPADVVVAEVSSFQLEGCTKLMPEAAVLTNLTQDHLYRHGTAEEYAACKRSLFIRGDRVVEFAAVGVDQEFGRNLADELERLGTNVVRFGAHESAQRRVLACSEVLDGGVIKLTEGDRARELSVKLAGWHNALNVAGALAISDALGFDPDASASALEAAAPLPGRFERINHSGEIDVIVDYAHNPDGVIKALDAARNVLDARGAGALIALASSLSMVGADQGFALGRAARERTDALVLTSHRWTLADRFDQLAPGLLEGAQSCEGGILKIEYDRREAIAAAIGLAKRGDIVLVLERGSVAGRLFDRDDEARVFDDRDVVREVLAGIGSE